jgi:predicted 3-demethylubiquinone-9 3-methyltransferase (glyoxalase superfamily)
MQKITPHLWFDKEAKEAAAFYTSLFSNSAVKHTATLHNTPSGSVDLVSIELCGQEFKLMSAGPLFKFTPAISFLVACDTKKEVDALWRELSKGGSALMDLGEYPFSERYGWTADRYGLSWQVMFMGEREIKQKIHPNPDVRRHAVRKSGRGNRLLCIAIPQCKGWPCSSLREE